MAKRQRRRKRRLRTKGDEVLGGAAGFLVGYIGAEATLQRYMHPLHWIAAVVVALLAYAGVLVWYYWRRVWREEQADHKS